MGNSPSEIPLKVLVTGGSGVVGGTVVNELVRRGHTVRLLSRNAVEDAARWNDTVEPWPATITDSAAITGSADDCDAVLHVAGIVS